MISRRDLDIDFNDNRTSLIERVLVYLGIACMLVGTISEVIQAVQAWQMLK